MKRGEAREVTRRAFRERGRAPERKVGNAEKGRDGGRTVKTTTGKEAKGKGGIDGGMRSEVRRPFWKKSTGTLDSPDCISSLHTHTHTPTYEYVMD